MNTNTYVQLLIQFLNQKEKMLVQLTNLTNEQEKLLGEVSLDMDKFQDLMEQKEELLKRLGQIDNGFNQLYEKVKVELVENKEVFKVEIQKLQEQIKALTDASVVLEQKERENKSKLAVCLSNKKGEIKDFKKSRNTTKSYYKNGLNQYAAEAYFFDKKN